MKPGSNSDGCSQMDEDEDESEDEDEIAPRKGHPVPQPELQGFILCKQLLHVILDQVISHPAVMREERGKRPSSREKAGYWDGEPAVSVGADAFLWEITGCGSL